ncbi:MAG: bis(5'-nucleosyl)-tetraphosphatase (symmetrical) YqeK [Anaerolineae bacterium]|nr:bis(5'-nucleosyl)-tetraphosphatase (symmetrical) YqeK [Anaerolineae bacterium]
MGLDLRVGRHFPLDQAVRCFLTHHACPGTLAHCAAVAIEARRLAGCYSVDGEQAEQAGWLHDVSAVVPGSERLALARALQLEVLPEEVTLPMLLHQKLSGVFAQEFFGIQDLEILSAIACHTTLRPDASSLDKVVFLADKIAWDGQGRPSYRNAVLSGLEISLDAGVCGYLDYLWQKRGIVPHPWFVAAYRQLCDTSV